MKSYFEYALVESGMANTPAGQQMQQLSQALALAKKQMAQLGVQADFLDPLLQQIKQVWQFANQGGNQQNVQTALEKIQQQADLSFAQWEKSNPQLAQQLKQQQNSQQASSPQLKPGQVITTIKSLEHLLAEFQKISAFFQPGANQKGSLPPGLKFTVQQYEVMLQKYVSEKKGGVQQGTPQPKAELLQPKTDPRFANGWTTNSRGQPTPLPPQPPQRW